MFTKICLALLGCYEWASLPSLPPWRMLLPTWFPFNIYQTSSWARATLVPLIPIAEKKLVFKFTENLSFDEFYTKERVTDSFSTSLCGDWKSSLFLGMDYGFKAMERLGIVPFRERGLKEVTRWFLARVEESGDFSAIYPAMFYSILYMNKSVDVSDPILAKLLLALKRFFLETKDELVVQITLSPVWDSAFVLRSLVESGIEADQQALQKAGEWLVKKQVSLEGDWVYNVPSACGGGGWAFEFCNR
ncbi:hypothetical protein KP509_24G076700 [Ceratopteris richardii]|uniref:Squalene cyclase C-terminal domain-containing protein n=1 Tax=Ceratopteris richardii TaxID=49495 RepID=A0A8T2RYU0_CERRI|nr:hypothetical protein KP509_24G076700 [Ceratopteris richardii]